MFQLRWVPWESLLKKCWCGICLFEFLFLFSYISYNLCWMVLYSIVTFQMIKFIQSTQFINKDLHMYHIESDTPALARTSNLNEELGQVYWWFTFPQCWCCLSSAICCSFSVLLLVFIKGIFCKYICWWCISLNITLRVGWVHIFGQDGNLN